VSSQNYETVALPLSYVGLVLQTAPNDHLASVLTAKLTATCFGNAGRILPGRGDLSARCGGSMGGDGEDGLSCEQEGASQRAAGLNFRPARESKGHGLRVAVGDSDQRAP
jgi:hypothetical protein